MVIGTPSSNNIISIHYLYAEIDCKYSHFLIIFALHFYVLCTFLKYRGAYHFAYLPHSFN